MTKREREVVALIAEGLSNKEMAERLNIAVHTVKSHMHNVLEKLGLHSRLQVAAHVHEAIMCTTFEVGASSSRKSGNSSTEERDG
jgi:DNA-binding CsgD family transcriptional regulator